MLKTIWTTWIIRFAAEKVVIEREKNGLTSYHTAALDCGKSLSGLDP